mgnify:CR=1 FL=1
MEGRAFPYNGAMADNQKSGFHYLGVGCLIAGVVIVLVGAVLGVSCYQWVQGVKDTMENPASRHDKVLDVLGAEELPDGYYPMLGISVPFLMDMAMLTDRPADEDGEVPDLGAKGLIFMSIRDIGGDREELDDFFNGRTDDAEALSKNNINIDLEERLAAGRIERSTGPILWVSHRGEMRSDDAHGRHDGLVTLLQITCPVEDKRNRLGIWFGPEPEIPEGEDEPMLAGTIADPTEVAAFVGHFRFCPE